MLSLYYVNMLIVTGIIAIQRIILDIYYLGLDRYNYVGSYSILHQVFNVPDPGRHHLIRNYSIIKIVQTVQIITNGQNRYYTSCVL